ncbi:hypothetical protein H8356DRAFT_1330159, partial [Neocallimastix lanati (nom. inval.)]
MLIDDRDINNTHICRTCSSADDAAAAEEDVMTGAEHPRQSILGAESSNLSISIENKDNKSISFEKSASEDKN